MVLYAILPTFSSLFLPLPPSRSLSLSFSLTISSIWPYSRSRCFLLSLVYMFICIFRFSFLLVFSMCSGGHQLRLPLLITDFYHCALLVFYFRCFTHSSCITKVEHQLIKTEKRSNTPLEVRDDDETHWSSEQQNSYLVFFSFSDLFQIYSVI